MAERSNRAGVSTMMLKFVGASAELPMGVFPTLRDLYKQALMLRERAVTNYRNFSNKELAAVLCELVKEKWLVCNSQLSSALLSDQTIQYHILDRLTLLEGVLNKKERGASRKKRELEAKLDKLFNILYCKCELVSCAPFGWSGDCMNNIHINCTCPRHIKVF